TLLAHPGEPLAEAEVELQTPNTTPRSDGAHGSRTVDADGRFRFDMILPGAYVLLINRADSRGALPYMITVEVGRNGLEKQIIVPRNQTIRGVLRVKDDVDWSGEVAVRVLTEQKGVTDREVKLRKSGAFEIDDIPPGEWQLAVLPSPNTKRTSDQ